jgi:hypothetical protein
MKMDIVTFGNQLADFESRLQHLETSIHASIEAVALERNAIMNSIDEAASKQLEDLHKYADLVRNLRGLPPANVIGLHQHSK